MAYTRTTSKQDIRNINLQKTSSIPHATRHDSPATLASLPQTNPYREMMIIGAIALPLIIVLCIASYYDTTHPWVIPMAQRILSTGK